MDLSSPIQAQLAGNIVRRGILVRFHFEDGIVRVWSGFGKLRTDDDQEWDGLAGMGQVGAVELAQNGGAPERMFTLSGVDAGFAAQAKEDSENWYGRPVISFLQFFDEDWQTLGDPVADWWGVMHSLTPSMTVQDDGTPLRTITLSAESPFAGRKRPSFSYWADRDQKQRFPGDKGCARTPGLRNKLIIWPDY